MTLQPQSNKTLNTIIEETENKISSEPPSDQQLLAHIKGNVLPTYEYELKQHELKCGNRIFPTTIVDGMLNFLRILEASGDAYLQSFEFLYNKLTDKMDTSYIISIWHSSTSKQQEVQLENILHNRRANNFISMRALIYNISQPLKKNSRVTRLLKEELLIECRNGEASFDNIIQVISRRLELSKSQALELFFDGLPAHYH